MKTILMFILVISFGVGSGVEGTWKATMVGSDGNMELTFVFKVEGDKLTGVVKAPMGDMPISNGKISGNKFSFDVAVNDMVIKHDCVLQDDIINMKVTGGPMGDS